MQFSGQGSFDIRIFCMVFFIVEIMKVVEADTVYHIIYQQLTVN